MLDEQMQTHNESIVSKGEGIKALKVPNDYVNDKESRKVE